MTHLHRPELYPAIDLLDGSCVRLAQGDYGRSTVYGSDPVEVALRFIDAGTAWVHIVDLNAARGDGPVNRRLIAAVATACAERGVSVQTGGGVRSVEDAAALFDAGVRRVVVGTAAVKRPGVVAEIVALQAGAVAVGLDAHGREPVDGVPSRWDVAVQGWTESSGQDLFDVLDIAVSNGATAVVATDISRDGMLTGPAIPLYARLVDHLRADGLCEVIASGGVSSLDDVVTLAQMPDIGGVIAGRAIYEGLLDVRAGVNVCRFGNAGGADHPEQR
jgi:phosphoribosylformimino-5-aminoimidazole carboxamide ribotide isomerase